jgi:hypothetical protein
MYEHKIIKLGFMFSKDDEEVFTIDESKWLRSLSSMIKEKNKPIIEETDFMTFDEVEIYINSMEKDGWLFQSIKPFKIRTSEARIYYAFFKKSINK